MAYRVLGGLDQFFSTAGAVLAGGTVTFYETGTSTLKNTYNSAAGTTANPNPITLNSAGYPAATGSESIIDVWGTGSFRVVLKTALGVTLRDVDPITDPSDVTSSTLSTVAALRALTSASWAGDTVYLLGHTTAGQGGGYFRKNGTDSTTTRIVNTTSGSKVVTLLTTTSSADFTVAAVSSSQTISVVSVSGFTVGLSVYVVNAAGTLALTGPITAVGASTLTVTTTAVNIGSAGSNMVSGSTVMPAVNLSGVTGLKAGMLFTGTGFASGTRYGLKHSNTTTFTASAAATSTNTAVTLTFSQDNNGTIVIDASGRRWDRVLEQPSVVGPWHFGALPGSDAYRDLNRLAGNSAIQWLDSGTGGRFDIGSVAGVFTICPIMQAGVPQLFDVSNLSNKLEVVGSRYCVWKLSVQWYLDTLGDEPDTHFFTQVGCGDVTYRDLFYDGSALELTAAFKTTLSATALLGATTVTLTDASKFRVGDEIRIELDGGTGTTRAITVIAGNDVSFVSGLSAQATSGNDAYREFNEQMHGIRLEGRTVLGRTQGTVDNVNIINCTWYNVRGDGVFGIGEEDSGTYYYVQNVLIEGNDHFGPYDSTVFHSQTAGRSGTAWQRNVREITIRDGYYYGITDADLDMEAGGSTGDFAGRQVIYDGNISIRTSPALAVTPGGISASGSLAAIPLENGIFRDNMIVGGSFRISDVKRSEVYGNIVLGGSSDPACGIQNYIESLEVCDNIFIDQRAVATDGVIRVSRVAGTSTTTSADFVVAAVDVSNTISVTSVTGFAVNDYICVNNAANTLSIYLQITAVGASTLTATTKRAVVGATGSNMVSGSTVQEFNTAHQATVKGNYCYTNVIGCNGISAEGMGSLSEISDNLCVNNQVGTGSAVRIASISSEAGPRMGLMVSRNIGKSFANGISLVVTNSNLVQWHAVSVLDNILVGPGSGTSTGVKFEASAGSTSILPFPDLLVDGNNGTNVTSLGASGTFVAVTNTNPTRQTYYCVGGNNGGHSARYVSWVDPNTVITAANGAEVIFQPGDTAGEVTRYIHRDTSGSANWIAMLTFP